MKSRISVGVVCAAFVFAMRVHASDIVVNGSFDADLSSWVPNGASGGSVTYDGADGAPTAGSAHLFEPDPTATAVLTQCIAFAPTGPVDLFGSTRTLSASGSAFTVLDATLYGTANCTGTSLSVLNAAVIGTEPGTGGTTWTRWGFQNATPAAGTLGVLIGVHAAAVQVGDSLDILWDHVQFGPSGTLPVELQSFVVE